MKGEVCPSSNTPSENYTVNNIQGPKSYIYTEFAVKNKLHQVKTLIDSGNLLPSGVAMSENLAKKLNLPMTPCTVKVGTAKKSGQMNAIGVIQETRFAVNRKLIIKAKNVLVIRDFNNELNIGHQFLKKIKAKIDYGKQKLYVDGMNIPMINEMSRNEDIERPREVENQQIPHPIYQTYEDCGLNFDHLFNYDIEIPEKFYEIFQEECKDLDYTVKDFHQKQNISTIIQAEKSISHVENSVQTDVEVSSFKHTDEHTHRHTQEDMFIFNSQFPKSSRLFKQARVARSTGQKTKYFRTQGINKVRMEGIKEVGEGQIKVTKNVICPPHTITKIPCKTEAPLKQKSIWVHEKSLEKGLEPSTLKSAEGRYEIEKGRVVNVLVSNHSDVMRIVTKDTNFDCIYTTEMTYLVDNKTIEKGITEIFDIHTLDEEKPAHSPKSSNSQPETGNMDNSDTKTYSFNDLCKVLELEDNTLLNSCPRVKQKAKNLIHEYQDIFGQDGIPGETDLIEAKLKVAPGTNPIRQKFRDLNPKLEADLYQQMDKMEAQGIIEASDSPWSSPLCPVKKKNGEYRWTVDFRKLNEKLEGDSYPLPKINTLLDKAGGHKVYSSLDAVQAYFSIRLDKNSRKLTAFATPKGLYHFKRLPFGISTAPAIYSRFIAAALNSLGTKNVQCYLDDVLVFNDNLHDHIEQLRKVFEAHRKANIKLNPSKTKLFKERVEYLGHQLSKEGIHMIDEYVQRIREWPAPKNHKQLSTLLGFLSYYRNFIPRFAELTAKMHAIKKTEKFTWTEEMEQNFKILKDQFTKHPIRSVPKFESREPFQLTTDFSSQAISAILSQDQQGQERLIAAGGRKTTEAEKKYPSWKGELCAIIYGIRKYSTILQFKPFIINTDSSALTYLRTLKESKGMIARWIEYLQGYDFKVVHRPGSKNKNADALSRSEHMPNPTQEEIEEQSTYVNNIDPDIIGEISSSLNRNSIYEQQLKDSTLTEVRRWINEGSRPTKNDLKGQNSDLQHYAQIFEILCIENDGVLIMKYDGNFGKVKRILIPTTLIEAVYLASHNETTGHFGIQGTINRIKMHFYFPNMTREVSTRIGACGKCIAKVNKEKIRVGIHVPIRNGFPMQTLYVDLMGLLPMTPLGNKWIMVMQDGFSRFVVIQPLKSKNPEDVAQVLVDHFIQIFGCPMSIHTDQGTEFNSELFKQVMKRFEIVHTLAPPRNPQSSLAERFNRTLNAMMRSLLDREDTVWDNYLPAIALAYNSKVCETTGVTPFLAFLGREARLPLDLYVKLPQENDENEDLLIRDMIERYRTIHEYVLQKQETTFRRNSRLYMGKLTFKEKELCWYLHHKKIAGKTPKHSNAWIGPMMIYEKISDVIYKIKPALNLQHKGFTVHVGRLKKYVGDIKKGNVPNDLLIDDDLDDGDELTFDPSDNKNDDENLNSPSSDDEEPQSCSSNDDSSQSERKKGSNYRKNSSSNANVFTSDKKSMNTYGNSRNLNPEVNGKSRIWKGFKDHDIYDDFDQFQAKQPGNPSCSNNQVKKEKRRFREEIWGSRPPKRSLSFKEKFDFYRKATSLQHKQNTADFSQSAVDISQNNNNNAVINTLKIMSENDNQNLPPEGEGQQVIPAQHWMQEFLGNLQQALPLNQEFAIFQGNVLYPIEEQEEALNLGVMALADLPQEQAGQEAAQEAGQGAAQEAGQEAAQGAEEAAHGATPAAEEEKDDGTTKYARKGYIRALSRVENFFQLVKNVINECHQSLHGRLDLAHGQEAQFLQSEIEVKQLFNNLMENGKKFIDSCTIQATELQELQVFLTQENANPQEAEQTRARIDQRLEEIRVLEAALRQQLENLEARYDKVHENKSTIIDPIWRFVQKDRSRLIDRTSSMIEQQHDRSGTIEIDVDSLPRRNSSLGIEKINPTFLRNKVQAPTFSRNAVQDATYLRNKVQAPTFPRNLVQDATYLRNKVQAPTFLINAVQDTNILENRVQGTTLQREKSKDRLPVGIDVGLGSYVNPFTAVPPFRTTDDNGEAAVDNQPDIEGTAPTPGHRERSVEVIDLTGDPELIDLTADDGPAAAEGMEADAAVDQEIMWRRSSSGNVVLVGSQEPRNDVEGQPGPSGVVRNAVEQPTAAAATTSDEEPMDIDGEMEHIIYNSIQNRLTSRRQFYADIDAVAADTAASPAAQHNPPAGEQVAESQATTSMPRENLAAAEAGQRHEDNVIGTFQEAVNRATEEAEAVARAFTADRVNIGRGPAAAMQQANDGQQPTDGGQPANGQQAVEGQQGVVAGEGQLVNGHGEPPGDDSSDTESDSDQSEHGQQAGQRHGLRQDPEYFDLIAPHRRPNTESVPLTREQLRMYDAQAFPFNGARSVAILNLMRAVSIASRFEVERTIPVRFYCSSFDLTPYNSFSYYTPVQPSAPTIEIGIISAAIRPTVQEGTGICGRDTNTINIHSPRYMLIHPQREKQLDLELHVRVASGTVATFSSHEDLMRIGCVANTFTLAGGDHRVIANIKNCNADARASIQRGTRILHMTANIAHPIHLTTVRTDRTRPTTVLPRPEADILHRQQQQLRVQAVTSRIENRLREMQDQRERERADQEDRRRRQRDEQRQENRRHANSPGSRRPRNE